MKLFKKANATSTEVATPKTATTVVVIVGTENAAIPFHLAHTIRSSQQADVLLIDNSVSQILFDAVPKVGNIGNGYEISVVSNRQVSVEAFKKFDYIVAYLGYTKDDSYLEVADTVILLSDYSLESRRFMSTFDAHDKPLQIVFFNKITGRVSERMLVESMQYVQIKAGTEMQALDFTEEDAVGYLSFQYDGFYPVGKMSKDYQSTMQTLVQKIKTPDVIEESEEGT